MPLPLHMLLFARVFPSLVPPSSPRSATIYNWSVDAGEDALDDGGNEGVCKSYWPNKVKDNARYANPYASTLRQGTSFQRRRRTASKRKDLALTTRNGRYLFLSLFSKRRRERRRTRRCLILNPLAILLTQTT